MNKAAERITGAILALAMILGNTIQVQAAGSATSPGTSSASLKMFAQANSILANPVGNISNMDPGADHQQLNITISSPLPSGQQSHTTLYSPGIGMWISADEIKKLPTSGTAWNKMRNVASENWGTPDLKDQDNRHGVDLLAGAFVSVRTGNSDLRKKVKNGILAAKRTLDEPAEWKTENGVLSAGRQIGAYVIAADLIDLKSYDAAADKEFRNWLAAIRTTDIGTHGRWKSITYTCENAAGNWNTFACASRIAASIYLGDTTDVDRAASIIQAFFGKRAVYPEDAPGTNDYFEHTAGFEASWSCANENWTGINPSCSSSGKNIDGALVEDASRGGGCCMLRDDGIMYSWEALQGLVFSTELLYRTGKYGNPYNWSDKALKRSLDFMKRSGWGISNVASYVPWLANERYGTSYPQQDKYTGRIVGWGNWLYQN